MHRRRRVSIDEEVADSLLSGTSRGLGHSFCYATLDSEYLENSKSPVARKQPREPVPRVPLPHVSSPFFPPVGGQWRQNMEPRKEGSSLTESVSLPSLMPAGRQHASQLESAAMQCEAPSRPTQHPSILRCSHPSRLIPTATP